MEIKLCECGCGLPAPIAKETNRFGSQVTVRGRNRHLGTYDTAEEATAVA